MTICTVCGAPAAQWRQCCRGDELEWMPSVEVVEDFAAANPVVVGRFGIYNSSDTCPEWQNRTWPDCVAYAEEANK